MKIKIVLLLFLIVTICACKNKSQSLKQPVEKVVTKQTEDRMKEVGLCEFGGEAGLSMVFSISQDSIRYYFSLGSDKNRTKRYQLPTDPDVWSELSSKFELEAFTGIESGGSPQVYDGTDREFYVVMESGKEYSVINGIEDSNYKRLEPFFNIILKKWQEGGGNSY